MLSPSSRPYADRVEAGTVLAERLAGQLALHLVGQPGQHQVGQPGQHQVGQPGQHLVGQPGQRPAGEAGLLVLGLPRGGIPVAGLVARRLRAPLDVLLVRKVGLPGQPELAMGAVAAIGDRTAVVANEPVLRQRGVPPEEFTAACHRQLDVLRQQALRYRGDRAPLDITARPVVVVDDGLATGASLRAAIAALRAAGAGPLIAAAPIGAPRTCQALAGLVDALVCPWQPPDFRSVSQGYRDFSQTSEATVIETLARAR